MYEVSKRIVLQRDEEVALNAIGWMNVGLVADLTRETALTAADLSIEYKLPMADSIILATARANNATLWTQDGHLKFLFQSLFLWANDEVMGEDQQHRNVFLRYRNVVPPETAPRGDNLNARPARDSGAI